MNTYYTITSQGGQRRLRLILCTRFDSGVETNCPLTEALDIFAKTEFAFLPVTIDHKVVTSLSLSDLLRVAAALDLDEPIRGMSSSLIEIDDKTSIGNALEIMLEKGVRSFVVLKGEDSINSKTSCRHIK